MISRVLFFVAGVLLVHQLVELPDIRWLSLGLIVALILARFGYWLWIFFVIGVVWTALVATQRLEDRIPEQLQGQDIQIEGEISDLPQVQERRVSFDFIVSAPPSLANARFRLSWYYSQFPVRAGQHWRFTVRLKRPHGMLNPGGFDYERWLLSRSIAATGYVRQLPEPVMMGQSGVWQNIAVWQQTIADHLTALSVGNSNLGIIKALTIGERKQISQKQWEVFRNTGTIHLMAISGLHIGLVAGIVYFLVVRFWAWTGLLRWSPSSIAAIAAMIAAVGYAGLAGFSIPTQRAVLMLVIVMAAIIWQRNARSSNTLALAMLTVVMLDPFAVLSAGFWLSFLAVSVIVYSLSGRLGRPGYWHSAIKIQWVTAVGLSPLLLFFFQQVSLIAPIANLIAVPVISMLVIPLSLVSIGVMPLSLKLAGLILAAVDKILQLLEAVLAYFAAMPHATLINPQPSLLMMLLALAGVLLLLAPRGIPGRWLGGILFLPLLFLKPESPGPGEVKITLLDVGQGLSAVIQTENHLLLFDTGARLSDQFDMGQMVILPFLRYQGFNNINALIISHGDNDHIGGAEALLRRVNVEKIYTSVPEKLGRFSPQVCRTGQSWRWDGVKFAMLSPEPGVFNTENNNSCVLRIESIGGSVMLTGDIEAKAEAWLVKTYAENLTADVLVVPHHGSKTSSTMAFLQQVSPQLVLIPAGFRNRYGFPDPSVLNRFQQINADWFNVAQSGAVVVHLKNGSYTLETQRAAHGKYWNAMN